MWQLIVEGSLLLADFVYHRYIEDHPKPRTGLAELQIPRTDAGAPVPLIYGRIRVKAPILAWCGKSQVGASSAAAPVGGTAVTVYGLDMFFMLGIPFPVDEGGVVKVHGMWAGEKKLGWIDAANGGLGQSGAGGFEAKIEVATNQVGDLFVQGEAQWLDGRPTQQLVNAAGAAQCWIGQNMLDNGTNKDRIVGYRGYLSIGLFQGSATGTDGWIVGTSPAVEAYSFDCSSYVSTFDASRWPAIDVYAQIDEDVNPVNALYDLTVGYFGKLGLAPSIIDMPSWQAVGITLSQEGHGYSRSIDQSKPARDHILELLMQIDATFYIDPVTGKVGLKLIRNDYNPPDLPIINRSNCKGLRGLAMNNRKGSPTMINVKYTNRDDEYRDGTAPSSSLAGSASQNGEQRPETVEYPGITTKANATAAAERELAARGRPMMKCTAMMDGTAFRWKQGDAVRVFWDKPAINGVVFRIASISHGPLRNGLIDVDLIQDYFYVRGNNPPVIVNAGGHALDTGGLGFGGG